MIFIGALLLVFTSSALFSMDSTNTPNIRNLLVKQARKDSVNTFNTYTPADRNLLQQACKRNNGRYDSDIANLLESTKHNQKFQDDFIATFVTHNPYAQTKFKKLPSKQALQTADDAKQLTTKSGTPGIPLEQSFLLRQTQRNLCHKIVDESVTVDTPKKRRVLYVDTDTYNALAALSPDIRQALGKRTIVVNRTFAEKLGHVGVSTVAYGLGGACLGATCGALEGAPAQYTDVLINNAPDIALALGKKGIEGVGIALKDRVLSPAGDDAIKTYMVATVDGTFGSFSDESPEPLIELRPLTKAAVASAIEAVPQETQKLFTAAPPLIINQETVVRRTKQGAAIGSLVGFVHGLYTMNTPIKQTKLTKIGTQGDQ